MKVRLSRSSSLGALQISSLAYHIRSLWFIGDTELRRRGWGNELFNRVIGADTRKPCILVRCSNALRLGVCRFIVALCLTCLLAAVLLLVLARNLIRHIDEEEERGVADIENMLPSLNAGEDCYGSECANVCVESNAFSSGASTISALQPLRPSFTKRASNDSRRHSATGSSIRLQSLAQSRRWGGDRNAFHPSSISTKFQDLNNRQVSQRLNWTLPAGTPLADGLIRMRREPPDKWQDVFAKMTLNLFQLPSSQLALIDSSWKHRFIAAAMDMVDRVEDFDLYDRWGSISSLRMEVIRFAINILSAIDRLRVAKNDIGLLYDGAGKRSLSAWGVFRKTLDYDFNVIRGSIVALKRVAILILNDVRANACHLASLEETDRVLGLYLYTIIHGVKSKTEEKKELSETYVSFMEMTLSETLNVVLRPVRQTDLFDLHVNNGDFSDYHIFACVDDLMKTTAVADILRRLSPSENGECKHSSTDTQHYTGFRYMNHKSRDLLERIQSYQIVFSRIKDFIDKGKEIESNTITERRQKLSGCLSPEGPMPRLVHGVRISRNHQHDRSMNDEKLHHETAFNAAVRGAVEALTLLFPKENEARIAASLYRAMHRIKRTSSLTCLLRLSEKLQGRSVISGPRHCNSEALNILPIDQTTEINRQIEQQQRKRARKEPSLYGEASTEAAARRHHPHTDFKGQWGAEATRKHGFLVTFTGIPVYIKLLDVKKLMGDNRSSLLIHQRLCSTSPMIVHMFGVGKSEQYGWYIAQERIDSSLDRLISSASPLPLKNRVQIAIQIARAVKEVHAAGIAHCKLRPESILITSNFQVKLADFNHSRDFTGITSILSRRPSNAGKRNSNHRTHEDCSSSASADFLTQKQENKISKMPPSCNDTAGHENSYSKSASLFLAPEDCVQMKAKNILVLRDVYSLGVTLAVLFSTRYLGGTPGRYTYSSSLQKRFMAISSALRTGHSVDYKCTALDLDSILQWREMKERESLDSMLKGLSNLQKSLVVVDSKGVNQVDTRLDATVLNQIEDSLDRQDETVLQNVSNAASLPSNVPQQKLTTFKIPLFGLSVCCSVYRSTKESAWQKEVQILQCLKRNKHVVDIIGCGYIRKRGWIICSELIETSLPAPCRVRCAVIRNQSGVASAIGELHANNFALGMVPKVKDCSNMVKRKTPVCLSRRLSVFNFLDNQDEEAGQSATLMSTESDSKLDKKKMDIHFLPYLPPEAYLQYNRRFFDSEKFIKSDIFGLGKAVDLSSFLPAVEASKRGGFQAIRKVYSEKMMKISGGSMASSAFDAPKMKGLNTLPWGMGSLLTHILSLQWTKRPKIKSILDTIEFLSYESPIARAYKVKKGRDEHISYAEYGKNAATPQKKSYSTYMPSRHLKVHASILQAETYNKVAEPHKALAKFHSIESKDEVINQEASQPEPTLSIGKTDSDENVKSGLSNKSRHDDDEVTLLFPLRRCYKVPTRRTSLPGKAISEHTGMQFFNLRQSL
eukprot:jgi/Bigna1/80271/fgenesh1_pg.69_\